MLRRLLLPLVFAAAVTPAVAQSGFDQIDVSYEKFVLDNGLTLIVHEDHKAPIVAVNIWYHVGSKDEKPGKTGFAHLFEHLMFNGSENFNDDYFVVLERAGATDLNGTTWFDRTNYFQNVPKNALDVALWMESDRMGHLLGAVDQEKLDEQRGVVKNEKRQGDNQPYGRVWNQILKASFPNEHPYSWKTIGSMEDLDAASLDDVKEWFRTYYGAANAVVVVAGDIDSPTALEKVKHYFGDIPAGPPLARQQSWVAKRAGEHREIMQDRVPQSRLYKTWNVPEWGTDDNAYLDLLSDVLTSGKTSRLYKRLVYDEQIATDVTATVMDFEIAGLFWIQATARPGVDLERIENAVNEEVARLLADGPTDAELRRVKTEHIAEFVRDIEGIGGFGGKSDLLARNQVYGGDPGYYRETLKTYRDATVSMLKGAGRKWLSDGVYTLEVHPFEEYSAAPSGADRSAVPDAGEPVTASFPQMKRSTLANGLDVIVVERHATPLVEMSLVVDAGYAADLGVKLGTASLAMNMLDEGTATRNALEISEALAMLGATLGSGSNLDVSEVSMSALKANLTASLDLFAEVILSPSFPEQELARLKEEQVARIKREKVTPIQMALRVFPKLLYGEGHAYSIPFTGSGTETSVPAIVRDDLEAFHSTWFRPGNATLVVVGDVTQDEIISMLTERFGAWKDAPVPGKNIATVDHRQGQSIYLVDRPGSEQSIIFAGHVAPPRANPDEFAIQTMMESLGGSFTSRINMNLREEKGWSYGAFGLIWGARGQRPFIAYAPVQSDKTKESMMEIAAELNGVIGANPLTAKELDTAKDGQTLTLPGRWETNNAVLDDVVQIVRYGLPDDYFDSYATEIRTLGLEDVNGAARNHIKPGNLVWVVVGDRASIEAGIRELGYGDIHVIDAEGNLREGGTH